MYDVTTVKIYKNAHKYILFPSVNFCEICITKGIPFQLFFDKKF